LRRGSPTFCIDVGRDLSESIDPMVDSFHRLTLRRLLEADDSELHEPNPIRKID